MAEPRVPTETELEIRYRLDSPRCAECTNAARMVIRTTCCGNSQLVCGPCLTERQHEIEDLVAEHATVACPHCDAPIEGWAEYVSEIPL